MKHCLAAAKDWRDGDGLCTRSLNKWRALFATSTVDGAAKARSKNKAFLTADFLDSNTCMLLAQNKLRQNNASKKTTIWQQQEETAGQKLPWGPSVTCAHLPMYSADIRQDCWPQMSNYTTQCKGTSISRYKQRCSAPKLLLPPNVILGDPTSVVFQLLTKPFKSSCQRLRDTGDTRTHGMVEWSCRNITGPVLLLLRSALQAVDGRTLTETWALTMPNYTANFWQFLPIIPSAYCLRIINWRQQLLQLSIIALMTWQNGWYL